MHHITFAGRRLCDAKRHGPIVSHCDECTRKMGVLLALAGALSDRDDYVGVAARKALKECGEKPRKAAV